MSGSGFPPPVQRGPVPDGRDREQLRLVMTQVIIVLLFLVVVMLGLWMAGLVTPEVSVRVSG